VLAVSCALTLTGCDGAPASQPPASRGRLPTVGTAEFEQRLTDHIHQFDTAVYAPEDKVAPPSVTTTAGCPGVPSRGVTPRAETTVSGPDEPSKQLQDLADWLLRNDFENDTSTPTDKPPTEERTYTHPDGTHLRVDIPPVTPQLTMVLTGPCTWPATRPGAPPPGRLTPLPAPSGPMSADGNDDCDSPRDYVYNTAAPPYAGPGPHPVALIDLDRDAGSAGGSGPEHPAYPLLPGWTDSNTNEVQLIVCAAAEQTPGGQDQQVTCQYDEGPVTFDVLDATYRITVLEAGTGAKVAAFTLHGTESPKQSCPAAVSVYDNVAPTLLRGIDVAGFQNDLRPLIENAR
jgi:hypothetical protein